MADEAGPTAKGAARAAGSGAGSGGIKGAAKPAAPARKRAPAAAAPAPSRADGGSWRAAAWTVPVVFALLAPAEAARYLLAIEPGLAADWGAQARLQPFGWRLATVGALQALVLAIAIVALVDAAGARWGDGPLATASVGFVVWALASGLGWSGAAATGIASAETARIAALTGLAVCLAAAFAARWGLGPAAEAGARRNGRA